MQILDFDRRGNWANITDGENIIYVQYDKNSDSFSISSVHKANRTTGTGFRLHENVESKDIIETIKNSFTGVPQWASHADLKASVKYANPTEFLNYEKKFWDDAHWIDFDISLITGK